MPHKLSEKCGKCNDRNTTMRHFDRQNGSPVFAFSFRNVTSCIVDFTTTKQTVKSKRLPRGLKISAMNIFKVVGMKGHWCITPQ